MKEILKKGLFLGLGAATLTRKQAEKMIKGFVKKGIVNNKEGRALVKRVVTEAKKREVKLRKLGEAEAKKVLKKAGIVSIAEAKGLKKKVAVLEKKLKQKGRKAAKKVYKKVKRKLR